MLTIRLKRVGRKNEPTFRLVLTDSKNGPKSGKSLEVLGSYDSRRGEKAEFNALRIKHWMSMGAKPSETVHNLLINKKIIEGKKINVLPKKKPIKKEDEVIASQSAPQSTPVAEAASAEAEVGEVSETAPEAPEVEVAKTEESTEAPKETSVEVAEAKQEA